MNKVYLFTFPHYTYLESLYILAPSLDEAIKIAMTKENNDYDYVRNCFNRSFRTPQVVVSIRNDD